MTRDQLDPRAAPEPGPYRPRPASDAIDPGQVLCRFQRSETTEVRIALRTYESRPFIDVRAWWCGTDGRWRPSAKGTSLRLRELPDVVRALGDPELRLAGGMRQGHGRPDIRDAAMEEQS